MHFLDSRLDTDIRRGGFPLYTKQIYHKFQALMYKCLVEIEMLQLETLPKQSANITITLLCDWIALLIWFAVGIMKTNRQRRSAPKWAVWIAY